MSQLPNELTLMMAAHLPVEDVLALRQASSDFLRVSGDPKVLRDQYRRAGLLFPKDVSTPEAQSAACGKIGRVMVLRRRYAIGPTSIRALKVGEERVNFAGFSPKSRFVLTASRDLIVRIWNREQKSPQALVVEGHTAKLHFAAFSPPGRFVVMVYSDGTARIWDLEKTLAQSFMPLSSLTTCYSQPK